MNLISSIRIALRALRVNKLRSTLTMLGIIIGVGAVIIMIAIGAGRTSGFSFGFGRAAGDRLKAAGLDVRYREDPVGHAIAPGALAQAREALEDALS